jgi:hypothetical protein
LLDTQLRQIQKRKSYFGARASMLYPDRDGFVEAGFGVQQAGLIKVSAAEIVQVLGECWTRGVTARSRDIHSVFQGLELRIQLRAPGWIRVLSSHLSRTAN